MPSGEDERIAGGCSDDGIIGGGGGGGSALVDGNRFVVELGSSSGVEVVGNTGFE